MPAASLSKSSQQSRSNTSADTRVLLAVSIADDAVPDITQWKNLLTSQAPWDITKIDVKVEAVFESHSTLLLTSLPIFAWDHLPHKSAYRFIELQNLELPPNSPNPARSTASPWNLEDDAQLVQARNQGMGWESISKQYFPTKTANACRKRHERLMNKRYSIEKWDPAKLNALALAYLKLREQMWIILADEVNEKWQAVESKVSVSISVLSWGC